MTATTWNPIGWRAGAVADEHGREPRTLSFSLETLIRVVAYSLSIGAAMWATTSSMRSDVRDIRTQLEYQRRLDEMQSARQDERMQQLRTTIDDMKRRQELQQYEIQGLKETILSGRAADKPR